ncbi:MAG: hypothetical protein FD174_3038 [Geobacteraceae bacterium]|nr:MAG: hypothetical protein FD174_3038 [Geobacteraceae bacterium]
MINEGWAFFCVIGFWGWVLATVGFILKAFPASGVFHTRSATLWGSSVVLFYVIWVMGMIHA